MHAENSNAGQRFITTHWTQVRAASSEGDSVEALDTILRHYQGPLKLHLKTRFHLSEDEADDCLHSFVEQKILTKRLLARANPKRGRFRTFLIGALDRFMISEHRRRTALRRHPQSDPIPLDELLDHDDLLPRTVPRTTEVAWARRVIECTLERMRQDCLRQKRHDIWEVFEGRLLKPILDHTEPTPYRELVERWQWDAPARAFNVLATAKRMFQRHLIGVVSEYAQDPLEAEREICELRAVVQNL